LLGYYSVWTCPTCSNKISKQKRGEIQHAIGKHAKDGGETLLITITNSHCRTDDLKTMVQAQMKAMNRFAGATRTQKIYKKVGHIGSIRAWEVTHGNNNGWHPHFHVLLFVGKGVDREKLQQDLFNQWANACRLAKLPEPNEEHGLRIDGGDNAAAYITKWNLSQEVTQGHMEVTKGNIKNSRKKSRTPLDLIRDYEINDDKQAGALFIEFAGAFKGKRQLCWSSKLKEHFKIDEFKEAVEKEKEEEWDLIGRIERADWKLVVKYRKRFDVLMIAEKLGMEGVEQLLVKLRGGRKLQI